jgi:Flp pilus assembly protein TadB
LFTSASLFSKNRQLSIFIKLKQKNSPQDTAQSSKNIALLLLAAVLVFVSIILFSSILTWVLLLVTCGAVIRGAIYYNYYKHLPSIY